MLVLAGGILAGGLLMSSPASAETAPTAAMLANTCAGCHGTNGVSGGPAMPTIAGLPATYMKTVMAEYKSGDRPTTIMGRIAEGYSVEEVAQIADFFSKQKWSNAQSHANSLNRTMPNHDLAKKGDSIVGKAKCGKCHEDDGQLQDDDTPRLAGQWTDYLLFKMQDYKNADMSIPQPKKMKKAIDKLSLEDLEAVSHFYATRN
jgi:sulfide dehydrogenase cytochrome subunit